MTLDELTSDDISERDLATLIGVRGGWTIEFLPAAEGFRFGAEVSSLANTKGGHLLIGIDVEGRVAKGFAPLTGDAGEELRRVEGLLRERIEPPIAGIRMRAVPLAGGGFVIVMRIPASPHPPHYAKGTSPARRPAIYARKATGAYEVDPRAVTDGFFG